MTQAAKKQRKVIGGVGADGELHVIAEIVPFVSSRLGPDVSCETDHEHESEWHRVATVAAGRADT